MEIREFMEGYKRMCSSCNCDKCTVCNNCCNIQELTEEDIAKVEEWIEEHPIMTNRMKFKELFVNAPMLVISKYDTEHDNWWDSEYIEPKGK